MNRLEEKIQSTKGVPLMGLAAYRYDPVFVEIIGHLGFHAVWIEMEHGPITFGEAANLCRVAAGVGLLTMIRIPDARRENVLRAAECGPDILDLPMANTPETLEEFARHARYTPQGDRGFFGSSRAVRYGVAADLAEEQRRINRELCLMAQIETREAVERAEALCSAPEIDAIFIGMGDLSASMGVPGETAHPAVRQAVQRVIDCARSNGKRVATACAPAEAALWASRGVDVLFCGSDIACLRVGAQAAVRDFQAGLARAGSDR
jgi:2-keto-3-deoxy-L-rhamnonate aldolase RhmA